MDLAQQKEKFSDAYLHAIAAVAGYGLAKPNPDTDSVDWILSARGVGDTTRRPRLEVQLKCSAQELLRETHLHFPLEIKNYNDLRHPDPFTPCMLVVVAVPENVYEWTAQSETEMSMRRCGYWMSLRGAPDTTNTATVTVRLPRTQILTPESLRTIVRRINNGGVP